MFFVFQSPELRHSDVEFDQRSISHIDLTTAIKSRNRISRFRHFCSCLFDFAIRETPMGSLINGSDQPGSRRLRLHRDIAFRDFEVLVVN
jgi:hypothetical protein